MIHTQDADFTLLNCDVLEGLRSLPDESVHCVVTSPPYWGLRDYGAEGQLGLEPTPEGYVARMVEVFREVRRVLRADGTCWLNIGDSYVSVPGGQTQGAGGQMADRSVVKARAQVRDSMAASGMGAPQRPPGVAGIKPKDLVGIPWRLAFALQADGWYLRSDIIWSKPNPMPESVTDRPTKAHEYVFLLSKSARYFFDAEAVREPYKYDGRKVTHVEGGDGSIQHRNGERWPGLRRSGNLERKPNPEAVLGSGDTKHGIPWEETLGGGRNVRSVWEIATQPYPEAHFATFPEALVERCVKAGTSEHGCCPVCGKPWERDLQKEGMSAYEAHRERTGETWRDLNDRHREQGKAVNGTGKNTPGTLNPTPRSTLGWRPGCKCEPLDKGLLLPDTWEVTHAPVPCTVLDPFLGSGTTAHVARRLGRRSIGIELNPAYCKLAARRMQQQSLFAA